MFRFLARGRTKSITSADEAHLPFDGREQYVGLPVSGSPWGGMSFWQRAKTISYRSGYPKTHYWQFWFWVAARGLKSHAR